MMNNRTDKIMEILRFCITGGIATLLQYLFYLMFVVAFAVQPEVSTVLSYGLSFIANFFLSNYFTFRTQPNKKKTVSFAVSHLINLGLQTLLVWVFCHVMPSQYALIPAMAICIPCNFVLVRFALKSKRFQ
ncbi:MAG: GtrA family protein [Bacteroidales bacterium]|nr:GtrA family protein [Bacteroidales bacterium]